MQIAHPTTRGRKTLPVVLQSQAWPSSQAVHVIRNLKFVQSGFRRRGGFPRPKSHKLVFQPGRFPFCELFQIAEGLASPHSKYLYVPTSKESRITVSNLKFAPTIWLNIFYFIYSDELETMLIKNQNAMTEGSPTQKKTMYIWALPKLRFDPPYCANPGTLWHIFFAENEKIL